LDLGHLGLDTLSTLGVGELDVTDPRVLLGVGHDVVTEVVDGLADGLGNLAGLTGGGGADSGVDLLVKSLELLSAEGLLPLGELLVESLGVVGLEVIIVGLDVATEDVRGVLLGVERGLGLLSLDGLSALGGDKLGLGDVEAGESLLLVGDVKATVGGTLHGTEDTVAGGGADETNIEVGLEGALVLVDLAVVHGVDGAVDLGVSLVEVGETLVGEESTGAEEAGAVGGGVVGETSFEAESSELLGVSGGDDTISLDADVDDLGDYAFVGATDAETVLPGVVLVLLLED
jgi:hypothetical protein